MKPPATYAEKVKELRDSLRLTQTEFAERMGSAQTTVSAIENGLSLPSAEACIRLAGLASDPADALWFLDQAGIEVDLLISVAKKVGDAHAVRKAKMSRSPMTLAEAARLVRHRAGQVRINVASKKVPKGADPASGLVFVEVSSEKDLTPEVLLKGKGAKVPVGEVNIYVTVDGKKLYFDTKTGELIGWK
jgi:transcriptional regulator with XRE-family HTH domain